MVFSSVFKVGFPSAGGMSSPVSNLSVVDKYFQEFRSWIKTPGHFQMF